MFSALGELFSLLIPTLKFGLRLILVMPVILVMMNIIKNLLMLIGGLFKNNLIGEIALLVQVWLPFNLNIVLNWTLLMGSSVLFFYAYKWLSQNASHILKD